MNELEYSYTVLKYRHDAAAGEVLNVGVVLFSAATGQVGILYDQRYSRLSQAFAHFDGELYKRVLDRLKSALNQLSRPLTGNLFELEERRRISDVSVLVRSAWPDQGLSYFHGPVMHGVTTDLERELDELFDRFVLSQSDRRETTERFDDEQLWDTFKRVLSQRGILNVLKPVTLGSAEVEFDHAYKIGAWANIGAAFCVVYLSTSWRPLNPYLPGQVRLGCYVGDYETLENRTNEEWRDDGYSEDDVHTILASLAYFKAIEPQVFLSGGQDVAR